MSEATDMKRARRYVEKAAAYLCDASSLLAAHGHIDESRSLNNISHDAAQALCAAEAHETPHER